MVKVKERVLDVEDILNRFEPAEKETVQNLRGLIRAIVPETVETVKHGKLTYKLGNMDFVWISVFRGHVDLEFAMGSSLDSPTLKSRGKEKSKENRHVAVSSYEKSKPEIIRLLKEAALLGFAHCKTP